MTLIVQRSIAVIRQLLPVLTKEYQLMEIKFKQQHFKQKQNE